MPKTRKQILETKQDEILEMLVSTEAEMEFLKGKDPEYEMVNQFGGKQKVSVILEDYETAKKNHEARLKAIKKLLKE